MTGHDETALLRGRVAELEADNAALHEHVGVLAELLETADHTLGDVVRAALPAALRGNLRLAGDVGGTLDEWWSQQNQRGIADQRTHAYTRGYEAARTETA